MSLLMPIFKLDISAMASSHPNDFCSPSVLHSSMLLPDDIWISHTQLLSKLKLLSTRKEATRFTSISDINDSKLYSTLDDIDTTSVGSDEPTDLASKGGKRTLLSLLQKQKFDAKSLRSAINKLEEHYPSSKTSKGFMKLRTEGEPQYENQNGMNGGASGHNDISLPDLNSFMRKATDGTRKALKKIKAGEFITSSKNLLRRRKGDGTGEAFTESLSSAGPSSLYHLPREMSPVSNNSRCGSNAANDMDTPFSKGLKSIENNWLQNENQDGNGTVRSKASDAVKYIQKWKGPSKVGKFIRKSISRNEDGNMQDNDSAWHSTSGHAESTASHERSLLKRFAKSLSY